MEAKKVFVVCKAGGVFEQAEDGSSSYRGGNARAFRIDNQMKFDELKEEVARRIGCSSSTMFFKYFILKNLVTVSNDEDVGEMIEYHEDSKPIELYVIIDEIPSVDISDNRQTTLPEAMAPADPSLRREDSLVDDFEIFQMGDTSLEDNQADDTLPEATVLAYVSSLNDEDYQLLPEAMPLDGPPFLYNEDHQMDDDFDFASLLNDDEMVTDLDFAPCPNDEDNQMVHMSPEAMSPSDASLLIVDNQVDDIVADDIAPAADGDPSLIIEDYLVDDIVSQADGDPNGAKLPKAAEQWKNIITGEGQTFSSVREFRESLKRHAVYHAYEYKFEKNDSIRVIVVCKSDGCPWSIRASRLSNSQLFRIKKMSSVHTCDRAVGTTTHQGISRLVAGFIKEKLKESPGYRPKDIMNYIKQKYGIQLTPLKASRAKEMAKKDILTEEYRHLALLCEKIIKENPRNLATLTSKNGLTALNSLFVSFHVSLCGFKQGCRPFLFLEREYFQGRILLTATTLDGDNQVFPVAFGLIDEFVQAQTLPFETNLFGYEACGWRWFLLQLKSCLSIASPITFVADRHITYRLKELISNVFPDSFHIFCLLYLTHELSRYLNGVLTKENSDLICLHIYAAADATRPEEFKEYLERIKDISSQAYNWIAVIEPMNWAYAFFPRSGFNFKRSDYIYCNMIYTLWEQREVSELPATQLLEGIQNMITELFIKRRADSSQWTSRLTPSMEARLEEERLKAGGLEIKSSAAGSTYEVVNCGDSTDVVDIDKWDCSCGRWQVTGIPCAHAVAVILSIDRSPYDYCSEYFTTEKYKLTYSE